MRKTSLQFSGKKVLVAEDHFINRELISGILKLMDCEVVVAQDGEEVVAVFQSSPFDLVFMDINMPKKDGYQATKEIRNLGLTQSKVPIVALTAYAMEGDKEKCLDAGMDDYISKPIDFDHLEQILKKYLGNEFSV